MKSSPMSYQAGALAFQAAMVEIERAHGARLMADEGLTSFGVRDVLPILRSAFDQYAGGELAAGFWDAFAYWIAQPFDGCVPLAESWDVIEDLAYEEDFVRRAGTPGQGVTP